MTKNKFWLLLALPVLYLQSARAEDSDFSQSLHAARMACWRQTYVSHPNVSLIACENKAIRSLTKKDFGTREQAILDRLLNKRLQIADKLDQRQITLSDYNNDQSDAVNDFENQISPLQCKGDHLC